MCRIGSIKVSAAGNGLSVNFLRLAAVEQGRTFIGNLIEFRRSRSNTEFSVHVCAGSNCCGNIGVAEQHARTRKFVLSQGLSRSIGDNDNICAPGGIGGFAGSVSPTEVGDNSAGRTACQIEFICIVAGSARQSDLFTVVQSKIELIVTGRTNDSGTAGDRTCENSSILSRNDGIVVEEQTTEGRTARQGEICVVSLDVDLRACAEGSNAEEVCATLNGYSRIVAESRKRDRVCSGTFEGK